MKTFSFSRSALEILFPNFCTICGSRLVPQKTESICGKCYSEIRYVLPPICRICGIEVHGEKKRENLCGDCLRREPFFSLARSLVRYNPPVQHLVHKLKYGKDSSVIDGLAEIIASCDLKLYFDCDCIIPVPLHPKRLRKRGFNQAVVLAKLFFPDKRELLKLDLLARVIDTRPQTKLNGIERRKNLSGAFRINSGRSIERQKVCLVDDVFTTGTTVNECSKILRLQGATEVNVLTFARVDISNRGR